MACENPYTALAGLPAYCGLDGLGSVAEVWLIRAGDVIRTPRRVTQAVVTEPIHIRAGAAFLAYDVLPDTGRFLEEPVFGPQGPQTRLTLRFETAPTRPGAHLELSKLQGAAVVAMFRDYNGHIRLAGSEAFPLQLTWTGDTGQRRSDRNAYTLTAVGLVPQAQPAVYLTPDIEPPNELLLPLAVFSILTINCAGIYRMLGSQKADGSAVDASVLLRYRWRVGNSVWYVGEISPTADPALLASWTITPGTRNATQFEAEVVAQVVGGTGIHFTLDTLALAIAASGQGTLQVDAAVIQGALISPDITQVQASCNSAPQAQNLSITVTGSGTLADPAFGDTLEAGYQYSDIDGDAEDTPEVAWFSYDYSIFGGLWTDNETQVGTGLTFQVPSVPGKSYTFKIRPRALTGIPVGQWTKCVPGTGLATGAAPAFPEIHDNLHDIYHS